MKILQNISLLILFALMSIACEKENPATDLVPSGAGESSLTINLSDEALTKSSEALKGDKIDNLRVWLSDETGKVVRFATRSYTSGTLSDIVSFDNLASAHYTVYVLANSTDLSSYVLDSYIDASFTQAILNSYDYGSQIMPLSYFGILDIGPGNNVVNASLVRTSARYTVSIKNHSNFNLVLSNLSLSAIAPDKTYLFDHSGELPSGLTYGSLTPVSGTVVSAQSESVVMDELLFEGSASTYSLNISGSMTSGTSSAIAIGDESTSFNTTGTFLIRNASSGEYLGVNGNSLVTDDITDAQLSSGSTDCSDYLWKFSGLNQTTLKNVGSGKYIYQSRGYLYLYDSYYETFTVGTSNSGSQSCLFFKSSYTSGYYWKYYYYLNDNSLDADSNKNKPSDDGSYWKVRSYTAGESKTFDNTSELTYIKEDGAVAKLQSILRNQHLNTVINLYYNEETCTMEFEVEPWDSVNCEISFE